MEIFKKTKPGKAKRPDEGIRPSLRGKYADMMRDVYTIYASYAEDSGVKPENEGVIRQMIFDQAMAQFENHNPVICLPLTNASDCELDMREFSVGQLADIAEKIRMSSSKSDSEAQPDPESEQDTAPQSDAVLEEEDKDRDLSLNELLENQ